jgi:hypothetical protein
MHGASYLASRVRRRSALAASHSSAGRDLSTGLALHRSGTRTACQATLQDGRAAGCGLGQGARGERGAGGKDAAASPVLTHRSPSSHLLPVGSCYML